MEPPVLFLERDTFKPGQHTALNICLSMIFFRKPLTLFGIVL
ncbi:hypothetical protein BF3285c2_1005 [Brucella vulpis]|nr:hypothetical protein BF3285c2_1005 [Brucella vulpis]